MTDTIEEHPFRQAFEDLEKWDAGHTVMRIFSDAEGTELSKLVVFAVDEDAVEINRMIEKWERRRDEEVGE